MAGGHERYERLVVGHVLGNLDAPDAGAFRSHLMSCHICRSRVAELRGIAADLAEIERDELAQERVRTQAPRRVDDAADEAVAPVHARITVRHVTVATVVVVVLAAAMGFWNLHLRTSAVAYLAAAEARGETLAGFGAGVLLEPDLGEGVTGLVASDGDTVSIVLARVEDLRDDESLIAWFYAAARDQPSGVVLARPGQVDDGVVSATLEDPGAVELVVSRERGVPGDEPSTRQLVRVGLLADG